MVDEGFRRKAEYYERKHHQLVKELLAIKKRIESLNLECDWKQDEGPD